MKYLNTPSKQAFKRFINRYAHDLNLTHVYDISCGSLKVNNLHFVALDADFRYTFKTSGTHKPHYYISFIATTLEEFLFKINRYCSIKKNIDY